MGLLNTPDRRLVDAETVLATATHRPVRIVRVGGSDVVRVDLELGRHILARHVDGGMRADPDSDGIWTVTVYDANAGTVAEATDEWLVDAFDLAYEAAAARPSRAASRPVFVMSCGHPGGTRRVSSRSTV